MICEKCLHADVCGIEGAFEEALTYCADFLGWIPVSERLPLLKDPHKIYYDVLITDGYEIWMGYLVKRFGEIVWHYYGSEFEVGINDSDNDAIAWMPLPEPYKAESEYQRQVEQYQYDTLYEPTFDSEIGSM